jgi:DNA-binding MarR family transcriptional regulator
MSEILEKLFRSKAEVKVIRLFLNNPDDKYLLSDIAGKSKTDTPTLRKELVNLEKIGFVIQSKKNQKPYYHLNGNFIFLEELRKLFFKANPSSSERIKEQIAKVGQIRLVLISGALINSEKGRVDILIVGEHINKSKLMNFLGELEAEVGKGIRYVYMGNDEFTYRRDMFDKFVIDILEGPNKVLINNLRFDGNLEK